MIVSHKHKFIFFKTRKTAGSSIQVALAKQCDINDIITGQYQDGIDDNSHSAGLNMDKFCTNHPHPELIPVKQFLHSDIWNTYFKFAFVRNPYDIVVSRYHWEVKGKDKLQITTSPEHFKYWLKNEYLNTIFYKNDFQHTYVCDNGKLDLNWIGRYETLNEDFNYLCKEYLHIPTPELGFKKSGYRDGRHYSYYYDQESIDLVSTTFADDIRIFGYEFEYPKDFKLLDRHILIDTNFDNNINGPSLIKVPQTINNRLGDYYLYFANHSGTYIRMAYANSVEGPYTIYEPGVLHVTQSSVTDHIASPDVHVYDDKIIMYYHGVKDNAQYTYRAESIDGINFKCIDTQLTKFYHREFSYLGETYAICKNGNINSIIYKKENNEYKTWAELLDKSRHCAVWVNDNELYIFYTLVQEAPERIYVLKFKNWEPISNYEIARPIHDWEGANRQLIPSNYGSSHGIVNQLRDPYVFDDNGQLYLLYSFGGESGIAIGKLHKIYYNK